MSTFPKTLYVTMIEGDEDEWEDEFIVENKDTVAEDNEAGTNVAVYQLVKVGRVEKKSKIIYEPETKA